MHKSAMRHVSAMQLAKAARKFAITNKPRFQPASNATYLTPSRVEHDGVFLRSNVSFGSKRRHAAASLDHLVSNGKHTERNGDAKRLRGLEVYNQFELSRLLNWQVRWLRPAQDFVDIFGGFPEQV
jgi:hypothetical protein